MNFSKKIYLFIPALLFGYGAWAQNVPNLSVTSVPGTINTGIQTTPPPTATHSGKLNYIRSFKPKVPTTDEQSVTEASTAADVQTGTVYKDGFNRDMLGIQRNFIDVSGTIKHLVQPMDSRFMRGSISYLPYTETNAGYAPYAFSDQSNYYLSMYTEEMTRGFSMQVYESDAGNRQQTNYAPGKSQVGQGRGVTVKQVTNIANQVRIWELNSSGKPVSNGYYNANELFGEFSTDVHGAQATVFKDKDGQVVCKIILDKTVTSGQNVANINGTTYYVYDLLGQLRYTIPPKATDLLGGGSTLNDTLIKKLCFQYQYSKGLVIRQQYPGEQAFTELVYDRKKRPIMRRSPNEALQNIWEVTFYDAHGRAQATSLYTNAESRDVWQSRIDAGTAGASNTELAWYLINPAGAGQAPAENAVTGNTMMSYTFYDDYSKSDAGESKWNNCLSNYLTTAERINTPGAELPQRSYRTHGVVTGSKVRVIPSPNADTAKTGSWKESAVFYDDNGRVIYTASFTLYHSNVIHEDYTASQYDFTGKALTTKHVFVNHNGADSLNEHKEWTNNEYDAITGRLKKVSHRVNTGNWQVLALYQYDGMGRVRRNILGNYGEVQDMSYNIRGQLDGINAVYAETGNKEGENRTFGESIKYDYGFSAPRYDGKISGIVWRGSNTTNAYAYGYYYDQSGRLTQADFRNKAGIQSWSNLNLDYSVSNLDYDLNGNIKSMRQKGMGVVGGNTVPVLMDDLDYRYDSLSNQLLKVQDPQADYNLGDFVNTNGSANDYTYDANGNLTQDNNKGILNISYTHFNKPQMVNFINDKKIEYSYDAAGNKVQELVTDPSAKSKRTDYLSNFVYQNDTAQYLGTGNGRSTFQADGKTREEFFVKDHLGNVRSMIDVYTYPILQYMATYELASANMENMFFENVDEVRDDRPGATWNGDLKSARLNGADPDRRVGTSMLVHVMAGDKVELNVNNFYENYNAEQDQPVGAEEMLASIISTLSSGTGGSLPGEDHDTKLVGDAFNTPNSEIFNDIVSGSTDPSKPKAYLNYILFDEFMRIVPAGSGSFQANGNGTWTPIGTVAPMDIPVNGFLAVYLTNYSQAIDCYDCGDVFFDQLVVRFTRGKLKEESHYYPFGLPMAGMGSSDPGTKPNRRKYQGNEYIKDLGLNWMDFNARQYDPQLGRFLGVDPLASAKGQERYSPYAAMGNAPESMIDPNGTDAYLTGFAAVIAFTVLQQVFGDSYFYNGELQGGGSSNWSNFLGNFISFSGSVAAGRMVSFSDNSALAFLNGKIGACEGEVNYKVGDGNGNNNGWKSTSLIQYKISAHYSYWEEDYKEYFNGAETEVKYNASSKGLSGLDWIQSITITKNGVKGDPSRDGYGTFPFYWPSFWLQQTNAEYNNTKAYFKDGPGRGVDVWNFSFDAELSLVGKNHNGEYINIATFKWGYMMPAPNIVVPYFNEMPVMPSDYQQSLINSAK